MKGFDLKCWYPVSWSLPASLSSETSPVCDGSAAVQSGIAAHVKPGAPGLAAGWQKTCPPRAGNSVLGENHEAGRAEETPGDTIYV